MYRIFISYSHQDENLVGRIAEILKENGMKPLWDRGFAYGHGFHDQIKLFIAHAHVFLPVITRAADDRKWVHQEIGYAMALNIPVLPVVLGGSPGEMIQQIHAVQLQGDLQHPDLDALKTHLSMVVIANLVQRYSDSDLAQYQCAGFAEDRAALLAKYSNDVLSLGEYGLVRQKGGLSSFHIPNNSLSHPIWKERYGGHDRGPVHCRLQRKERIALDAHARMAGCRLIINPNLQYRKWGRSARIVRLRNLIDFLESMDDGDCQVAIDREMKHDESLTIVGDWFFAESVSARVGQGYRQTIFSRHAPSMLNMIEAFDLEFQERLDADQQQPEHSRLQTIDTIRDIISELERNSDKR